MSFTQNFSVVGSNLAFTAIVAIIPTIYFFWALAIKKMKGYIAALTTLMLALIIAVIGFKMPAGMAAMSAVQGAVYGLLPICWIILTSVFLYNLTVKSGLFDIIRNSIQSITEDRRLQVLLIAFSFGSFLEGAAGFGAPVAISAALLVGLGFKPLPAALYAMLANTTPVAFGAIGIPITAMEGPTGISAMEISQMVGRTMPILAILVPIFIVFIMSGFKRTLEVIPAILVTGISYSIALFLSSNYLGPELPDILSAIVSLIALIVFLRFWKPKTIYGFKYEEDTHASSAKEGTKKEHYSPGQILKAWSPFLVLTVLISVWGIPSIKLALTGHYDGTNVILSAINSLGAAITFTPEVPLIHDKIINSAGETIPAIFKIELLGAAGTAILIAAIITKVISGLSWKDWGATFLETFNGLKLTIVNIAAIVAFAYITNSSGMTSAMGMTIAKTGALFPFFSPILGWLGVFITGSDTTANLLFGNLQKVTAMQVGMNPLLALGANCAGGGVGKMISPQSIAIGCAAVGLVGKESDLLRLTLKYSIILVLIVSVVTFLQTNVLSWMIP